MSCGRPSETCKKCSCQLTNQAPAAPAVDPELEREKVEALKRIADDLARIRRSLDRGLPL